MWVESKSSACLWAYMFKLVTGEMAKEKAQRCLQSPPPLAAGHTSSPEDWRGRLQARPYFIAQSLCPLVSWWSQSLSSLSLGLDHWDFGEWVRTQSFPFALYPWTNSYSGNQTWNKGSLPAGAYLPNRHPYLSPLPRDCSLGLPGKNCCV